MTGSSGLFLKGESGSRGYPCQYFPVFVKGITCEDFMIKEKC